MNLIHLCIFLSYHPETLYFSGVKRKFDSLVNQMKSKYEANKMRKYSKNNGIKFLKIIFPSFPIAPVVAQAATTLLGQIILPIAAPADCIATIVTAGKPIICAASN